MSRRQTRKMLRLMAGGGPVEVTSAMASVKRLARLAFVAQQFGYEYADVRYGGANNSQFIMLIVPDPSPQARARAAQNWAEYPNAHDGVSVPPPVPDALELLKARINFDLTGRNAERRMLWGVAGATVGCVLMAFRFGNEPSHYAVAAVIWLALMGACGIGFVVNRRRNATFAARLRAAGFVPVTDGTGRVRHLPPSAAAPGHGSPHGGGPHGGTPYGVPAPALPAPVPGYGYGYQPGAQPQQPVPHAPSAPHPYGAPSQAPEPYAPPQAPYGQQPPR
ncbi:hypothetical protein [Streptomyces sp. bgisy022]|uniref:hypothetical protein n=1 Tax=Streptomyces sp. bgisy022 TaxID=3413769 RepID=UPI003D720494